MKYSEFVTAMRDNQDRELVFGFQHGTIRRGYHITEVFGASVSAVDCGGAREEWEEVILQLLDSGEAGGTFMGVRKALEILEKSGRIVELEAGARIILEYRPDGAEAAQRYTVSSLESKDGTLMVQTKGATTQCKAAGRGTSPGAGASACCTPGPGKQVNTSRSACCG